MYPKRDYETPAYPTADENWSGVDKRQYLIAAAMSMFNSQDMAMGFSNMAKNAIAFADAVIIRLELEEEAAMQQELQQEQK